MSRHSSTLMLRLKEAVRTCNKQDRLIAQLVASLKSTTAHAIDMTCELNDTDDVSDYPYLARAQSLLRRMEKERKRASRQR